MAHVTMDMESMMVDCADPDFEVEVSLREDGEVLWVNVDGVCRLRVCGLRPEVFVILDGRTEGSQ